MTRTVKYCLRSPSGGLAANLTAHARPSTKSDPPDVQIHGNVRLALPPGGLHWKDLAWLSFGVALNAPELTRRFPQGITIQVTSIEAPLSDYRSEVAALAINLWLREEFEIPFNNVDAKFNPSSGDYEFRWNDEKDPFSDPLNEPR
ncbi:MULTISPECIES: hypothetical protein [Streptomyces]|uniref:Uncharacterized protein n=1 Tax=Streptomyces caniscabiei TaxID=2746961 RepID=A0ABU4MVJ7_9ACTN|nr:MULTISPECIES: hypothetical protein [Streptomyces]MDX2939938.1 hypothetical protein [Streptomyces caniscabiei]MDX2949679.1 hypothetical protein [Streptomyces caniscabiei]MDX2987982.1 hypothetical protein [Streptomyces caniscabiei]MDX3007719.1 hypothetical protein [Streptomyces caniscabiei]MDX3041231.1 hypothetical protein [Streptomyces caniscabiei]